MQAVIGRGTLHIHAALGITPFLPSFLSPLCCTITMGICSTNVLFLRSNPPIVHCHHPKKDLYSIRVYHSAAQLREKLREETQRVKTVRPPKKEREGKGNQREAGRLGFRLGIARCRSGQIARDNSLFLFSFLLLTPLLDLQRGFPPGERNAKQSLSPLPTASLSLSRSFCFAEHRFFFGGGCLARLKNCSRSSPFPPLFLSPVVAGKVNFHQKPK